MRIVKRIPQAFGLLATECQAWWMAFVMNAPGRIGAGLRKKRLKRTLRRCGANLSVHPGVAVVGADTISIGEGCGLGARSLLTASDGEIVIGDRVLLNTCVFIGADFSRIEIGDHVMIGPNVSIRSSNHRYDQTPAVPMMDQGHTAETIVIGSDVWIGANAVILPGAVIGDHSIIAAGSVVLRGTYPAGVMLAGTPATIKKRLIDDGEGAPPP